MTTRMSVAEFNKLRTKSKPRILDACAWNQRYDSKLEAEFADTGYKSVIWQYVGSVRLPTTLLHHPMRLYLPGGSYSPDFLLQIGTFLFLIECKGSRKQKNYRDARSKLRAAAAIYKMFRFIEVRKENGQWIIEEI